MQFRSKYFRKINCDLYAYKTYNKAFNDEYAVVTGGTND